MEAGRRLDSGANNIRSVTVLYASRLLGYVGIAVNFINDASYPSRLSDGLTKRVYVSFLRRPPALFPLPLPSRTHLARRS